MLFEHHSNILLLCLYRSKKLWSDIEKFGKWPVLFSWPSDFRQKSCHHFCRVLIIETVILITIVNEQLGPCLDIHQTSNFHYGASTYFRHFITSVRIPELYIFVSKFQYSLLVPRQFCYRLPSQYIFHRWSFSLNRASQDRSKQIFFE